MKTYFKRITFYLVGIVNLICFVGLSEAKTLQEVVEPSVVIKCYTELSDGSKSINFWHTKPSHQFTLANDIIGSKGKNLQEKELPIVRVYQCIFESETFKDSQARNIESKLLR